MYTHELFNADTATANMIAQVTAMVNSYGTEDADETSINIQDYRDIAVKAGVNLTDEEIIFAIAGVNDDLSAEDWAEVFKSRGGEAEDADEDKTESTEAVTVDQHTANSMEASAKAFAKNLEGTFVDTMFDIQEADEKSKRGIAIMLWDRLHGSKAWDADVWNSIPDLDITEKEAKEKKLNVLLPRWKVKDGNRQRAKDWFEIAIANTTKGAALVKYIEDLTVAGTDQVKTKDQQALADNMTGQDRANTLGTMESRLANMVNRLKRMVRLKRRVDAINEVTPLVQCGLIPRTDKDGNEMGLATTIECLYVQKWNAAKNKILETDSYIPNTFLRLDPVKAQEIMKEKNTDFFAALKQTKDRPPAQPGDGVKIATSEDFVGVVYSQLHYFEQEASLKQFQKDFAANKDENDQLQIAEALETLYMKAGAFFNYVKPTMEKLQAKKEAAKKAAQEATKLKPSKAA